MVDDRHATNASHQVVERQIDSDTIDKSNGDLYSPSNSLTFAADDNSSGMTGENRITNTTALPLTSEMQISGFRFSSSSSSTPATTTTTTTKTLLQPAAGKQQHLGSESLATNIFLTTKKSFTTPLISQEKFHWDQTEQGHILGAFFYGYILFQIPGARMAESVGAKWIIMAASAGSAVISLAFPLSTQLNSIYLLMVLRFVMGLCQSAFFPAAYVIFCRWLPERERSVLLPIMFIGSNMGSISTYIMSSYLISSSYGWPSVFYLSGLVCSIVSLFWCIFGSNKPEDNWFITEKERHYIESNVNNQSSESNSLNDEDLEAQESKFKEQPQIDFNNNEVGEEEKMINDRDKKISVVSLPVMQTTKADNNDLKKVNLANTVAMTRDRQGTNNLSAAKRVPRTLTPEPSWSKLLKSMPVWTLILSMYGNEWSNVVLCFELPTYLNTALGFPIEQNGVINSFFQFSYAVASPIVSSLGAYMLDRHLWGMRKIHVRKLFQSLATFGQLACFVSVPICGANRGLIIMFMFLAIVFKACANAGDIMISGDLSPGKLN